MKSSKLVKSFETLYICSRIRTIINKISLWILFFLFFTGSVPLSASDGTDNRNQTGVRTIYIVRHAQRGRRMQWPEKDRLRRVIGEGNGQPYFSLRDSLITPLGEKQCMLLGEYLRKLGFHGKIYSSPSIWAIQTAVGTASAIGPDLKVIPEPALQSRARGAEPDWGTTCSELLMRFPGKIVPVNYPDQWILCGEKEEKRLYERMERFLIRLLENEPAGEILLVGHSSSLPALLSALNRRLRPGTKELDEDRLLNCCLYVCKVDKYGKVFYTSCDTEKYLPPEMPTSNFSKVSP